MLDTPIKTNVGSLQRIRLIKSTTDHSFSVGPRQILASLVKDLHSTSLTCQFFGSKSKNAWMPYPKRVQKSKGWLETGHGQTRKQFISTFNELLF